MDKSNYSPVITRGPIGFLSHIKEMPSIKSSGVTIEEARRNVIKALQARLSAVEDLTSDPYPADALTPKQKARRKPQKS